MHISLTPELEKIIQDKVKSGYYSNASEVVRDAIRHLHERDDFTLKLRNVLQVGIQDIENGRTVPYDMSAIRQKADEEEGRSINPDVQP